MTKIRNMLRFQVMEKKSQVLWDLKDTTGKVIEEHNVINAVHFREIDAGRRTLNFDRKAYNMHMAKTQNKKIEFERRK